MRDGGRRAGGLIGHLRMPESGRGYRVSMAVTVVEFTDPGCPFAYSAEPHRLRLQWLYGDHEVDWNLRMVVLARSPQEYLDKGFTPDRQSQAFERISAEYGMPIDPAQRPRMAA